MQIEDCVIQTLDHQITLAVTETQFIRWERIIKDLKAISKNKKNTPSLRKAARIKLDEAMDELENWVKNHKSKVLDLSVLG